MDSHISPTFTTYQRQHHPSHMGTRKHHTNSKTKQRHDIDTSYRPISFLSVIAKTLEKTLLPYITNNIPHNIASKATTLQAQNNTTQHKQHHRNRPQPKHTITAALEQSIRQSTYIDSHINYTKQTSHTPLSNSSQTTSKAAKHTPHSETKGQYKDGLPQGGVLSPTLFNIYTSDNTTGTSKIHDQHRRHHHNINTQRHKHCKSKYPIIPTGNAYMDTDKQPHSQPRQNNMHSLHTRPSRIQHTTFTTNRRTSHSPMNTNPKY